MVRTAGIVTVPLLQPPYARRWLSFDPLEPPAAPPARPINEAQRDALDVLRRAGATLGEDFAVDQLKTAFRRLARRLHPDVHPGAGAGELRRLAVTFSNIREAYLVLRPLG